MAIGSIIVDSDKFFEIDVKSRQMSSPDQKNSIVQFDHKSERFTFRLPRIVEGHDMLECNAIEVHYVNIDMVTKEEVLGIYEIKDIALDKNDSEYVTCTWLIEQNATQKVGLLKFAIRFMRIDSEGEIEYSWNTAINSNILVTQGICNSGVIAEKYADILEQWRAELFNAGWDSVYSKDEVDTKDKAIINEMTDLLREVETIIAPKSIIGDVQGFIMVSNGEPSTGGVGHDTTKRTDYINITGYDKLVYTGRMSAAGYAIAFYDADEKLLTTISFVGTGTKTTKEIDLTIADYSSAKYVIVSSFDDIEPQLTLSKNGNIVEELDKIKEDIDSPTSSEESSIGFEKLRDVVISNNICDTSIYEIGYYQYHKSAADKYVYNNSDSYRTVTILNKDYHSITISSIFHYYTLWDKDGKCIAGSAALGALTNYVLQDIDTYGNVHSIKVTIKKADLNTFMAVNGEIGVDFEEMPPCNTYGYRELYNLDINELKADVKTLKGKKIMLFGDSITDPAYTYSKWVTTMVKETGAINVGNFAISGSKLAHIENATPTGNHTANKSVPNQVQYMLNNVASYETPDIIIVFASTNDNVSTKVGYDSTQFDGDLSSCDLTTFSGAMRWVYEKLIGQFPNALVVFVTPLQSADIERPYATQLQKRNAIIENCERLAVDFVDAFRLSGIYDVFEIDNANGKYLADGLHPNSAGQTKIAKCVQNELMKLVYKL